MSETGLSGRLNDFNLEEILQLIALQQKTGLLRVEASYPMALYFEQGILVSYRDRRGSGKDPLETFLKSYGFFAHSAWEHVEFVQRNAELDLTEILLNEGLLDEDGLAAVEQQAAQEYLHQGMVLRDGRYQFLSGRAHISGLKGRVRMKADGLLMEAVRRIDEMPSHIERYYAGEATISRTEVEVDHAKLSPFVQRVWSLLEAERPVRQLIANARMSEFELYTTLEALREQNLIAIHAPEGGTVEELAAERQAAISREPSNLLAALVVSAASIAVVAGLWFWVPARQFGSDANEVELRARVWRDEADRAQIEAVLDLYYGSAGKYPPDLETLRSAGFLPADQVHEEIWNYSTVRRQSGYELELLEVAQAR